MSIYSLGSSGEPVAEIQNALKALGLYRGEVDAQFGGGTHSAVVQFQKQRDLVPDGRVGAQTWSALIGNGNVPVPPVAGESLSYRCLALTGAFETGVGFPDCFCGISGDFDGQGISFGVMQWNFGQGSLQPLLRDMISRHGDIVQNIFGEHFDALNIALTHGDEDRAGLMSFVRGIQHPQKHRVFEPWLGYAKALGRTAEFQRIQVEHAQAAFQRALKMCDDFDLWSERAAALMFDIVTQNGSINAMTRAQIVGETGLLAKTLNDDDREVAKMRIIANRRAEASSAAWIDDVRRRKLCIANGAGSVHGIHYDIGAQFSLNLVPRNP
ncbi:hypothetical protein GCM10025794_11710 [Massilia kyonggiensis]|nr:peptidoglycan-binding protein [Massilia kyonggiensis]